MVLAAEQSGVLVRSFLIAVAIMAPVALFRWRRVRRRQQQHADDPTDLASVDDEPPHPRGTTTIESLVARISEVSRTTGPDDITPLCVPTNLCAPTNPGLLM